MPVWPTCFWICWPMPRPPPSRLPAAITPMSCIRTPASARAPRTAPAPRSTTSLSGCLPNFVMWMPRIQTVSRLGTAASSSVRDRLEAEAEGLGAGAVGAERVRRQPHLHAQREMGWVGVDVDDVGPHAGPVAVDDGGHEGDGEPRRGVGDDREGPHLTGGGHRHPAEVTAAAVGVGAGVAAVEVPGAAGRALVGLQMRITVEHQVVDDRDRARHAGLPPRGWTD